MAHDTSKTLRTPLKWARGLGSAKHGTDHWWHQRLTALALVPLALWFVIGVIAHVGASHAEMAAWLRSPVTATLMILTIAAAFHHGQAGMQVVYEDYLHHEGVKLFAIIATKFACFALAAASILAVLKLFLGA